MPKAIADLPLVHYLLYTPSTVPDTEKVLGRVCGANGRTPEKGAGLEDPLRGQESGLAEVCTVAVAWGRAGHTVSQTARL